MVSRTEATWHWEEVTWGPIHHPYEFALKLLLAQNPYDQSKFRIIFSGLQNGDQYITPKLNDQFKDKDGRFLYGKPSPNAPLLSGFFLIDADVEGGPAPYDAGTRFFHLLIQALEERLTSQQTSGKIVKFDESGTVTIGYGPGYQDY